MLRVDTNLCLLLCAAAALCTAVAASPLLHAYMGSLDYGGQPPYYEMIPQAPRKDQDQPLSATSGSASSANSAAPPNHGYMGSLDYGGQPPSYESAAATWPVDQHEGAPTSLLAKPGQQGQQQQQAAPKQPRQQGQSPSRSSGFGLLGTLIKIAGGATEVVGDAVGRTESRVGTALMSGVDKARNWLFG